ncbi:MAG: DNA-binding protein [Thermoproteota archaeon]|nr:MAG: DNA-binding protein [Candidatus Korarchaeota archaeon]
MSADEAQILRERAYAFLRNARRLLDEGEHDLAAFCIEQFCQLLIKHKLLLRLGSYPRTHSLVRLMRLLDSAVGGALSSFIDENITVLARMEDVYITARYLPRRLERREVEELLSFAERLGEVVEGV